jgi:beta-lactamase class A/beta-lactamase class A VEB
MSNLSYGQGIGELKAKIDSVLKDKDALIGISILGMNPEDTISINGTSQLPMQSVYKYHLALTVLNQIDQGKLNLNDTIEITEQHLDNDLWSMIRRKHPNGTKLTLGEVLKYTVANSDNVGCDILFDLIGGPTEVENYMRKVGVTEISIKDNEATIQSNWETQYQNWITPNAAIKTLKIFCENEGEELSSQSHAYLWDLMKKSWLGEISMKTHLPENTVIAHKTGHSGKNDEGLTAAQNGIGIIFLPKGNYFYISILISNSTEESEINKRIIADVTKLTYDYFDSKNE